MQGEGRKTALRPVAPPTLRGWWGERCKLALALAFSSRLGKQTKTKETNQKEGKEEEQKCHSCTYTDAVTRLRNPLPTTLSQEMDLVCPAKLVLQHVSLSLFPTYPRPVLDQGRLHPHPASAISGRADGRHSQSHPLATGLSTIQCLAPPRAAHLAGRAGCCQRFIRPNRPLAPRIPNFPQQPGLMQSPRSKECPLNPSWCRDLGRIAKLAAAAAVSITALLGSPCVSQ